MGVTVLVQEKRSIYLAIELSLREISYVLQCMRTRLCARANDAKIVRSRDAQWRSRDAQCNTKESP